MSKPKLPPYLTQGQTLPVVYVSGADADAMGGLHLRRMASEHRCAVAVVGESAYHQNRVFLPSGLTAESS